MAEHGADEAGRLEAALDRIARASRRAKAHAGAQQGGGSPPGPGDDAVDVRALSARLDALIAELRGILGQA